MPVGPKTARITLENEKRKGLSTAVHKKVTAGPQKQQIGATIFAENAACRSLTMSLYRSAHPHLKCLDMHRERDVE